MPIDFITSIKSSILNAIVLLIIFTPLIYIYSTMGGIQSKANTETVAVSTNSGSKSSDKSTYIKYVGAYPVDFLVSKENSSLLKKIRFSNNEYFDVSAPIYREGNFIIGKGCKKHECSTSNGIFYLNLDTNFLVVFIATLEQVNSFTVNAYCESCSNPSYDYRNGQLFIFNYDMPQSVNKWLAERP